MEWWTKLSKEEKREEGKEYSKLAKSSEDTQVAGFARFEKVWAGYALGRKFLGQLKLCVEKLWAQNICIDFLAELDNLKKIDC